MSVPKYNVNEVEERTRVPGATLRQWERRYGFPMPHRTDSGYRLYSDEDVALIEEMKEHIAAGVSASRAAELVKIGRRRCDGPRPLAELQGELLEALLKLDETRANEIMSEAHALHPVEAVMLNLVRGTMVEIGNRWHQGEVSAATEHYASAYMSGRLRALLSLAGDSRTGISVIVACAPLEQHELGPLILAVLLRRAGYRVFYLGANMPLAELHDMARALKPGGVFLSASTALAAEQLMANRQLLLEMAAPLIYGGAAFDENPELAGVLGGCYFGCNVREALDRFHEKATVAG